MKKAISTISFLLVTLVAVSQLSKIRTANFALQSGDVEKAIEAVEEGIQDPKAAADPKSWYVRGDAFLRAASNPDLAEKYEGALEIALESFNKSLELDAKNTYRNENIQGLDIIRNFYFERGQNALQNNDFESCYQIFTTTNDIFQVIVANSDPTQMLTTVDSISLFYKAYSAQLIGKSEEAKAVYQSLVDMGFNDKFVYTLYGKMLSDEEDYDAALAVIRRGQQLFPEDTDLMIDELNIYLARGNADEAVDRFNAAIEKEPNNADLRFALGTILDRLYEKSEEEGDTEKAALYREQMIAAYQGCIDVNPEYFKAVYNLGVLFFNEAVEMSKAMNNLPLNARDEYKRMEESMIESMTLAKPYLEKAHQLDATDLGTMKALKEIYLRQNDMENFKKINDAIKAAEAAGE